MKMEARRGNIIVYIVVGVLVFVLTVAVGYYLFIFRAGGKKEVSTGGSAPAGVTEAPVDVKTINASGLQTELGQVQTDSGDDFTPSDTAGL